MGWMQSFYATERPDELESEVDEDFLELPFNPYTDPPIRRTEPKIGRNEACPCGSGRKFKKCCGNPVTAEVALRRSN
jgi:uncharacterized protein YecA (UPF0149 family)